MWVKSVGENIEQKNIQLVVRERAYHAGEEGRWVRWKEEEECTLDWLSALSYSSLSRKHNNEV